MTDAPPQPTAKPPARDLARAEALRANLLRRKAQARARSDAPETQPTKSEGDA